MRRPTSNADAPGSPFAQQRRLYPAAADGYRSRKTKETPGPAVFLLECQYPQYPQYRSCFTRTNQHESFSLFAP